MKISDTSATMEDRFKALKESNRPENRTKWALEWKKQGKQVMGLLCSYVPEELVSAAGMLPWRITGTWKEAAPLAGVYRPEMTCRYCSHALESVLNGELSFLDAAAGTQLDDDFKRLLDVLIAIRKPAFTYMMYLPHASNRITMAMWVKSVLDLQQTLEKLTGVKITEKELRRQVGIYNRMRTLLSKVYELRKRDNPPITGAEALGLTTAARIMPREIFNDELEELLPYLEHREIPLKRSRPRLLMCGEYLDHPGYVDLVEKAGAVVVMDDFDTGSRYFWDLVEESSDNIIEAIARRYLNKPGSSRMVNWNEQAAQIVKWVKEYDCDGIVELRQLFSLPLDYRFFALIKKFTAAGIPYISVDREYHLANEGMLRTRVEAFIEMILAKAK
ncbi:MAG: 2-hydroxyacyl-CoA dehydratase family protein [Dehalococcoidia bacterium]|nr:2-hydroxyacyl-CoA dehydratase family protein [Dehalococcoidia bacterium]